MRLVSIGSFSSRMFAQTNLWRVLHMPCSSVWGFLYLRAIGGFLQTYQAKLVIAPRGWLAKNLQKKLNISKKNLKPVKTKHHFWRVLEFFFKSQSHTPNPNTALKTAPGPLSVRRGRVFSMPPAPQTAAQSNRLWSWATLPSLAFAALLGT